MITFKQFLDEGFFTDTRAKLMALKKDVSEALGIRRYQVIAEAPRGQNFGNGLKQLGQGVRIFVYITEKDADHEEIYTRAVKYQIEKALVKHFGEFEFLLCEPADFSSARPVGRAIHYICRVRDEEGDLG